MSNNGNKIVGAGCLASLVVIAVFAAFVGWIIMLLWGVIAPAFDWSTIGFDTAVAIGLLLSVVGALVGRSN